VLNAYRHETYLKIFLYNVRSITLRVDRLDFMGLMDLMGNIKGNLKYYFINNIKPVECKMLTFRLKFQELCGF
jgi:hypothetical protein